MQELAVTCPVEDCKLTVDIVLKSSDGELFGAHQRNLEIYTDGFPIAGSTVVSDGSGPVPLEETAEVLCVMLNFTHHTRLPNLNNISFTFLASLAEAMEKYMIYSGMEICRMKMMHAKNDHPNEVFLYSVKHNYLDLADETAELTLNNPPSAFLVLIREAGLHEDIAFRWIRYHDYWMEVLVQLPTTSESHYSGFGMGGGECTEWDPFQLQVFKEIRDNFPSRVMTCINNNTRRLRCTDCQSRSHAWALEVRERIEKLPKYSEAR